MPQIKDWLKPIRKKNGIVGFATQSARDALSSGIGDSIIEQCPTQIFMPNHKADTDAYCGGFGLTEEELRIVRGLDDTSRCFLLKHGTHSVVAPRPSGPDPERVLLRRPALYSRGQDSSFGATVWGTACSGAGI